MKKKILFFIILFYSTLAFSQEGAGFSIVFHKKPLSEVLLHLEKKYDVRFSYQDSFVKEIEITIEKQYLTLLEVLALIEADTSITFQFINERYIVLRNNNLRNEGSTILDEVVIASYITQGISKQKDASFLIKPEKQGILPGLVEADVLESIQQLPGVISPNENATGFTVRGGNTDQNRVIWDGITMYHKGHMFGMISPFNPQSTAAVVFYNKGTHPRFGERVSSVIDISSTKAIADKINASVDLNAISAAVFLDLPIIKNKLSLQGSFRRSYTDFISSYTFQQFENKVFQHTKVLDIDDASNDFYFLDYNLKLNYQINKKNSLHLSTIYIDNHLNIETKSVETNVAFKDILDINNVGYSLEWNKIWNENLSQKSQVFLSKYRFSYNFIIKENNQQASDFDKQNVIFDSGFSTHFFLKLKAYQDLNFGYQYTLKDVNYAFLETSDLSFVLDTDKTVINSHSAFGNYTYKNKNLFDISIGLRANYFKELQSFRLEPRLLFYKKIFTHLGLQLSGEIKNQIISEIDETVLSDLSLENSLWRLADGDTFPIINSKQASLGFLCSHKTWALDIDYFYKKIKGITALSLGFLNPEDAGFHLGEQESTGVDFYVKKKVKNVSVGLSYSFSNVKNKFEGLNQNRFFKASTQINHAFSSSIIYKYHNFQTALAWHWRTGKPFTKALRLDADGSIFFNEINSEKLKDYHRLDFSATYVVSLSKSNNLKGKIGFSIKNVYNKKNQLTREYTGNNNLNDPVQVVDKYGLGFTPNFLLRVYW